MRLRKYFEGECVDRGITAEEVRKAEMEKKAKEPPSSTLVIVMPTWTDGTRTITQCGYSAFGPFDGSETPVGTRSLAGSGVSMDILIAGLSLDPIIIRCVNHPHRPRNPALVIPSSSPLRSN